MRPAAARSRVEGRTMAPPAVAGAEAEGSAGAEGAPVAEKVAEVLLEAGRLKEAEGAL